MKKTIIFRKKNKKQIEEPFLEKNTEEQPPPSTTVTTTVVVTSDCIKESATPTDERNENTLQVRPQQDLPTDDFNEENDEEEIELFAENKRSYERKYFTINRAADFVRSKAKLLRRRHILNSRCFDKPNKQEIGNAQTKNKEIEADANSIENNTENSEEAKPKQRYLWQNARKRMNYVVRLIQRGSKEEDDEVLLMEEGEEGDFSSIQLSRSHSCSSIYEPKKIIGTEKDLLDSGVMNMKYLSPKGRKLDRFVAETNSRFSSNRNSCKSSRRSSLDSSIGPMNFFLSQKYLKQSQSQHSISTHGGEQEQENKQEDFEQEDFFYAEDFEQEGDLQCIQNNLYNSVDDDLGNKQFSVAENEYEDIIDKEVNNYITDYDNHKSIQPYDEQVLEQHTSNKMVNVDNIILPNIKHTATISYSVNDLYDLFNKDSKFKSFEASFEDLVV